MVVLISVAAIVNLETTVFKSNKLLEEISKVRTDLFTLRSRVASLDSVVNDIRNQIEKSDDITKSVHFTRPTTSLEKVVLKVSVTFSEFTEGSQLFLNVIDENADVRSYELESENGVFTAMIELFPEETYHGQVRLRDGDKETLSKEFAISHDLYNIQHYQLLGHAWLLETDKIHYSIDLYTQYCRDEELRISEAVIKVVEGEDSRETLFLPLDNNSQELAKAVYY
ncbi:hypothetical protein V512_006380 [Mesotoga sp. Brook.08.105.5.1]|nr:hypothetical protein V512_006380 [Mesotoga sp. Brook.08.105.5.1]